MDQQELREQIRAATAEVLRAEGAKLVSRHELRSIVSHQVERVLQKLRRDRERSLELYGAPNVGDALDHLDRVTEKLGEAFELAGFETLDESLWGELLQNLTTAWAAARAVRRELKPNKSVFVAGLHDDSEPLTGGEGGEEEASAEEDASGAGDDGSEAA